MNTEYNYTEYCEAYFTEFAFLRDFFMVIFLSFGEEREKKLT